MKTELNLYKSRFLKLNSAKYSVESIIGSKRNMRHQKQHKNSGKDKLKRTHNGESGTGKELFAHAVHSASKRSSKPFICINLSSIPEELMERAFGYEEGAFTGAKKGGKIGLFRRQIRELYFLTRLRSPDVHAGQDTQIPSGQIDTEVRLKCEGDCGCEDCCTSTGTSLRKWSRRTFQVGFILQAERNHDKGSSFAGEKG